MAVIQELQDKAPMSIGPSAPGYTAPQDKSGSNLTRLIGLPGAVIEWSLLPIRIGLAIGVLVLAFASDEMESVRTLWAVVIPVAILYAGFVAYWLWRGRVRGAVALGIVGDLTVASLLFPILHYVGSRDDPDNLTYMAGPGVALVRLAILTSTMRLTIWPAVAAGLFMTLVPASVAWYFTADGVPGSGLGGEVLTFAAAAVVFTVVGQALQRSRRTLEHHSEQMQDQYAEELRRSSERDLLVEIVQIVSQSPDVRETYQRFVEAVRRVLPADRVSVNLYEEDRNLLLTTYVAGKEVEGWEEGSTHSPHESNQSDVVEGRRSIILGQGVEGAEDVLPVSGGEEVGLQSAAIVPLLHQGALIGTLALWSEETNAYDRSSAAMLERIGAEIAPAIANARLYSTLESDTLERTVFAEISRILSASPNISDAYDEFAAQVRILMPWERITVNVVDLATGRLRTAYAAGREGDLYPTGQARPPGRLSISVHITEHGEGILVEDLNDVVIRFPDTYLAVQAGLRSGLYVPLLSHGGVIGTMAVGSDEVGAYDNADLELLNRLATQIAGTIANSELRARTDRQAREETALAEIGRIITSSPKIDDVYDQFVEQVRGLMPADRVSLIEIDPDAGALYVRYVNGFAIPNSDTGSRRALNQNGVFGIIVRTGEALSIPDIGSELDRFEDLQPVYDSGVRSALYSPLRSGGQTIGILCVASRDIGAHDEDHLALLNRVSAQIAGALVNAGLHERVDALAREEAVMAEIGRTVNSSLDIEEIFEQFAEQVAQILKFDRIAITQLGPGEGEYTVLHVIGAEVPELEVGSIWTLDETPFSTAIENGETLFLHGRTGSAAEEFASGMRLSVVAGIRSSLIVPLIERDRPAGFFSISAFSENAYTEKDAVVARRVADLVLSALTNAELFDRSTRQAREEAALGEIGRIITASHDIEDVYDQFSAHLGTLMPADRVSVIEVEPDTGEMSIRHVTEFPAEAPVFQRNYQWSPNGLMEYVASTGKGLVIPDLLKRIDTDPAAQFVYDSGVRSLLYTPLRSEDRVIGLLCVVSAQVDAHNVSHFNLLERISAQIAGALANAKLHEITDQQAREEAALGEIGRIVNSSLDIQAIYDQFAEQVQQILPFDRLAIAIRESDVDYFRVAHVSGVMVPGLDVGTVREIDSTNLRDLFEKKVTLVQTGDTEADREAFIPGTHEGLTSSVIVPLISRDEAIGFIALRNKAEATYSNVQTVLVQRIATLVSTAISNSDLYERTQIEARERAVLVAIGRIVGSSLDIDTVYGRFADQVRQLIDFDRISISYVDSSRSSAISAWEAGDTQTGFGIGREIPIKAFVGIRLGQLMRRRMGAVLDEVEIKEFYDRLPWPNDTNTRSMICVPLVSDGRTIAGLAVSSLKPDAYGDRELDIVTRVAAQVAGAVANARLHQALQDASDGLVDINKQKTELMTTVAHELRSPLTAFNAFLDLVLDRTAGEVPEKQLDLLQRASSSSVRMQNILNVFSHLEMAEDTSVPLTVTMIDMDTVITGALDLLQPSANHAGVEIEFEKPANLPMLEGDRQAIDQIISNLVSNSIKYSHERGVVTVKCEATEENMIVSVRDTGLGISPDDQKRLFERFYRGSDPAKLHIRGTGLGLYVSKGLVERHHGRMWCQSEIGVGSEFSFSLPIEQPLEEPATGDVTAA